MNFVSRVSFSKEMKSVFGEVFQSKLFWLGLFLKLVFCAIFASKFLTDFFLPFVNFYSSSGFANPYEQFVASGKSEAFPYPSLMLFILAIPYSLTLPSSIFSAIFVLRIPILLADLAILLILSRWLKQKTSKLLLIYWLSPVLIYINYIHGQLDAIPIAVMLISFYFLFKEKFILSTIFLAAAIACKTNILLIVPIFFIYLFSLNLRLVKIASLAAILGLTFLVINAHYLTSDAFISMVFLNKEQGKIFDLSYPFHQDILFYLIPAAYFLLLIKAVMIRGYNRDIFIMFLGFSFGVITLFIPPMQGWYYWIIPFFCYFYIKENRSPVLLLAILQLSYFAYFVLIKNSDFPEVLRLILPQAEYWPNLYQIINSHFNADRVASVAFTILQTSLLVNCVWIYREGISSYTKHKLSSKPYLIGISGDSGTGKTSLVNYLCDVFGEKNVTAICGDDMHKWERGHEKWQEFTHLNPSANKLHEEISFLRALKKGQKILRKNYDHATGKFTDPKTFAAKKIIISEGLHSFYVAAVRDIFDLRIFIKPEKQLQNHWKIIRDQQKRGHSKEAILEQIRKREDDSEKFISSQEKYADVKVDIFSIHEIKNLGDKDEQISLRLKLSFENSIDVEPLLAALSTISSLKINHEYEDGDSQFLEVSGFAKSEEIKAIGDGLLESSLEELNIQNPEWNSDLRGVLQLFLAFYIIETEVKDEEKNS